MIEIELPWPDRKLSPNSRAHWRAKSAYQQAAHRNGYALARNAISGLRLRFDPTFPVVLVFCPPNNRRRDLDNLLASMKHYLDGIADALDVDDRRFRPVTADWGDVRAGGAVIVRLGNTRPATAADYQRLAEERYELPANRLKG